MNVDPTSKDWELFFKKFLPDLKQDERALFKQFGDEEAAKKLISIEKKIHDWAPGWKDELQKYQQELKK